MPAGFRFSVKLARTITHDAGLVRAGRLLDEFFEPVRSLGDAFGCLLVQLPPKLALDPPVARRFFAALAARDVPAVALEPRHASWFSPEADALLAKAGVCRVAADPARAAGGDVPGGARAMSYWRLHGAPRTYYSAYDEAFLARLAEDIARDALPGWCIFDNTAGNAAVANALALRARLAGPAQPTPAAIRGAAARRLSDASGSTTGSRRP